MAEQLLSTAPRHDTLPQNYIRPESQRPRLSEVVTDTNIPIIDLSSPNKSLIISQIANACEKYGLFQVVNHGITEEMLRKVMGIGKEFFRLPPEEKAKLYSDDPAKKMRLSTSFNVRKETVHNWRDYLRLHCYPLEEFVPDWPSKPELFKEIMSTYCTQVRQLGFRLFGYISEGLGLETDYIENVLGEQEQHLAVNYYPQCPEPELTYGLPAHTDPNALTILLQDQQVSGLQVLKEGKWIAVDPVPWALTINMGDQLQATVNIALLKTADRACLQQDCSTTESALFAFIVVIQSDKRGMLLFFRTILCCIMGKLYYKPIDGLFCCSLFSKKPFILSLVRRCFIQFLDLWCDKV
ncbi:hypothetical protein LUZ63_010294 [Rhynchospora breviuscula]|uniref:Fe2OG dioxygenase domain-containing protein n=1 Tax=Rhynchospora breviuscula TaxID=2022672 RepID=A0A9Q0HPC2_9POAL|nr:hypothetical protein LUZ63_010294 [Rhynchospora breviuscula]